MPVDTEKAARARELYAKGYTIRQIATRINSQYQTARRYVDPAYDELLRQRGIERKKRYRGTCEICGASTSYSGHGTLGAKRCQKCAAVGRKFWTREKIIEAIQQWAKVYGRPPSSVDWNAAIAKQKRSPEYPSAGAVYDKKSGVFETWADAVEAAGFPRPKTTYSGRFRELTWSKESTLDALRLHSDNGVAPRSTEWDRKAPGRPTVTWVARLFGSWANACHEAGLLTYREAYYHGRPPTNSKPPLIPGPPPVVRQISDDVVEAGRLAFVQRVMDDLVPRRFVVSQLWQPWGFSNQAAFARWLAANGLHEFPGHRFRPRRQLTREELDEAHALSAVESGV